jgi:hypothetical protein
MTRKRTHTKKTRKEMKRTRKKKQRGGSLTDANNTVGTVAAMTGAEVEEKAKLITIIVKKMATVFDENVFDIEAEIKLRRKLGVLSETALRKKAASLGIEPYAMVENAREEAARNEAARIEAARGEAKILII